MTLEECLCEISILDQKMSPLEERMSFLERERCRLESLRFIEVNGVTEDNLQRSSGDGIPYFYEVNSFAKWLKAVNCKKRFCEWNGSILFTAEVVTGSGCLVSVGRVQDLAS